MRHGLPVVFATPDRYVPYYGLAFNAKLDGALKFNSFIGKTYQKSKAKQN